MSPSIIFVKLCFNGLPFGSTKVQRKMNDTIVSYTVPRIAKISMDTSPCPSSMWIFSSQYILKGLWSGQTPAGGCVGLCRYCSGLFAAWGGQSCPAVKVHLSPCEGLGSAARKLGMCALPPRDRVPCPTQWKDGLVQKRQRAG